MTPTEILNEFELIFNLKLALKVFTGIVELILGVKAKLYPDDA